MPMTCKPCRHPRRAEIDAALVQREEPLRHIAARFGTSATALVRHRAHLSEALTAAQDRQEDEEADGLLEQVRYIAAEARRLAKLAERKGDLRTALVGLRELARAVELLHGRRLALTGKDGGPMEFNLAAVLIAAHKRRREAQGQAPGGGADALAKIHEYTDAFSHLPTSAATEPA